MANRFTRIAIPGGDDGVWDQYEEPINLLGLGNNTLKLFDDSGTLKLAQGRCGLDDGSQKGTCIVDAETTISIAALTVSLWAKVELSKTGTTLNIEITSIAGASNSSVLPSEFTSGYDPDKQGYYLLSSKRTIGLTYIDGSGNLDRIINCLNGELYREGANSIVTNTPAGVLQMYAGSNAPVGWLICNGSAISRTTYADLYREIGTTFGVGDGSTTFNIPDFGGIFPRGAGTNTQLDDAGGSAFTATLGTYQNDASQGHRHTTGITYPNSVYGTNTVASTNGPDGSVSRTESPETSDPVDDGSNGTPRTAVETRPANLAVNFIIKV